MDELRQVAARAVLGHQTHAVQAALVTVSTDALRAPRRPDANADEAYDVGVVELTHEYRLIQQRLHQLQRKNVAVDALHRHLWPSACETAGDGVR